MMTKKKVLIVDDDSGIRESLKDLLSLEHFECFLADTGEKGLALLESERPHLVVLDLQLPDMSGYQFCQVYKKSPALRGIPVMMMTARFTEQHDKLQGFDLGADEYFTKPFDPMLFLARMRSILRSFDRSLPASQQVSVNVPERELVGSHH